MNRLKLTLTAESPIAIGEWMTSRSNVRESLSYIPGGVLRGALAQLTLEQMGAHKSSRRILNHNTQLQQAFTTVFGKNGARFSFLMPFGEHWIPAPATALFNKQDERYLYDTLFALIRGKTYEMQCPRTRERLERGRGYLEPTASGWRKAKLPDKTTYVRVGLNRATEAAEEGALYAIEAIEPSATFTGYVDCPDPTCHQSLLQILDALRWREGTIRLRLGSARSRGFGEVVLQMEELTTPSPADFQLEAFAQRAGQPVFTLLVCTPTILYDACGQPAPTLTPELLREYLPNLPASVQLLQNATRIERELVSGWSGAWGMPKPVLQAFAPGSVFTYTYDANDANALAQCLQQLATTPIGARTAEGYGQLIINSQYHLDCDITLTVSGGDTNGN
jgi:CRISPR-associated protein Csx10